MLSATSGAVRIGACRASLGRSTNVAQARSVSSTGHPSYHPNMDLRYVSSRELNGQELKGYTKRKIIYENLSPEEPFVQALGQSSSLIIDLSADYRFDGTWGSYGLPELVHCPGCYSTGSQFALVPTLEHLGAGTRPSPKNDVNLLHDNRIPYSLTGHIHEREISHHLDVPTAFIPHSIQNKHRVEIGGFAVDSTGKRVVVCAMIDNLNKGAATQCLQNMNLALGYGEYQGIPTE
ncbi:hypothetical protein EDB81DRAFT_935560 [Dactylonectria macrodidyma]|uniref:N-acetyl-gamma-glutamyl-phosphate reductase dimerisation domain-containing protein n=1 Tax=Dactylonectria macrodidyma TaxID=307937 RepID=A0A9P9ET28_9HYPO|nr:hypothetical protein EDB81DRAFT_935560 [Dactylonectria macrodidyma]